MIGINENVIRANMYISSFTFMFQTNSFFLSSCSSLVDTWRTLTASQTSNIIEGVVKGLEHIHLDSVMETSVKTTS